MPFGTHSEQHQIEPRQLTRLRLEHGTQLIFGFFRRLRSVRVFAVDAVLLLRLNRGFRKHRFRGHAKVALGMVRRHMPFIAKKELYFVPRHFCLKERVGCQESVKRFRCGTARERDREGAILPDGFLRCLQEFRRGRLRDGIGIRQYSYFSIVRHRLNAPRRSPAPPSMEPHSARTTRVLPRSASTNDPRASAVRRLPPDPSFPRRSLESVRPELRTTHPVRAE